MVEYYARIKLSANVEFEVKTDSEENLRKLIDDLTDKLLAGNVVSYLKATREKKISS